MSLKAIPPVDQDFSFCLLKHFKDAEIRVQGTTVKFKVEQLCDQDIYFLFMLRRETDGQISVNISRSAKGLVVLIGIAKLQIMPQWLIDYVRSEHELAY